jgi:AraC-like DNA-binding protein
VQVSIGWIQLAAAVGAAQGLLLAVVLYAHRSKRTANRLLGALMLAFTVYLLEEIYYSGGLVRSYPHLFGFSYPLPWVFGPLVFLYTVAASDASWRFRPHHALHFAPVIAVVVATLPIYLLNGRDKIALYERLQAGDVPTVLAILSPFKYVSGVAYSVVTIQYLRQHSRRIENSYSNTARVNLRWLLWLAGAAAAIWLLAVAIRILSILPQDTQRHSGDLVAFAIALLVYAIGYMGFRQPEIHRFDDPDAALGAAGSMSAEPREDAPSAAERDARYERSGLSDIEATALKARLVSLMTSEHPYRDPDLTLPDLAERLATTPHKLSEVLNAELRQTFYEFVNSYRVDDVRRRIAEGKSNHLKMLALAMDAGFSSKSTFNEVFKKRTGQTPSMYRKALAG